MRRMSGCAWAVCEATPALTPAKLWGRVKRGGSHSALRMPVLPFKHGTSSHFQNYQPRSLQSWQEATQSWQEATKTKRETQHDINQVSSTFDGMCSLRRWADCSRAGWTHERKRSPQSLVLLELWLRVWNVGSSSCRSATADWTREEFLPSLMVA